MKELIMKKTLHKMKEEKTKKVKMLVPVSIELRASEFNILKDNLKFLTELGFEIEEFGINTIIVKSHPSWLITNYEEENIKAIIDLVILNSKKFSKEKFLDSMAKMVSCKMSIKANSEMSFTEIESLLDDLMKCDNPYNCCHGRPLIVELTYYELEKMFKRVL